MTPPILVVSRQTQGFLERGHPWVLPDRFTVMPEGVVAGDAVLVAGPAGRPFALALADPGAPIVARVVARDPKARFDTEAIQAAIAKAWARRGRFHADANTTCWRLVHGEADGLPGLRVEIYATTLIVVVFATAIVPHLPLICRALQRLKPWDRIVVKEHLDDLRRAEATTMRWSGDALIAEPEPGATVEVRELGTRLLATPCGGLATGVYLDQRGTRRWLRKRCVGQEKVRVLNLFAYTGAFSASLLAAGAVSATDVDLSAPSLETASANAALNGLGAKHRAVHADVAEFLAGDDGSYDLVLIDPPTAAQGGSSWVLRRDYPPLLSAAWKRVAKGGLLLAACNTLSGKPFPLDEALAEAGKGGAIEATPDLDPDIPQLAGFPEGRPFRLAALRR